MKVKETVREDGMRIISCLLPHRKRSLVEFIATVGSAYDPEDQRGLFHCFEHMAFKGTQKRTVDEINSFSRRHFIANTRNASTKEIYTNYHGVVTLSKLDKACDLLSDLFYNATFPDQELEREKNVVVNEIKRDNDRDSYVAYFNLWKNLWKENPMRIFGVGTEEGMRNTTREDLISAKNTWYVPSNTTVLATGGHSHETLVSVVNALVPLSSLTVKHKTWSDEYDVLPEKTLVTEEKSGRELATAAIGCKFPAFKWQSPRDRVLAILMNVMIGQGERSLLHEEVREKRGLAYTISSYITKCPLGSYFTISFETQPQNLDEVIDLSYRAVASPLNSAVRFEEVRESLLDNAEVEYESIGEWAYLVRNYFELGLPVKNAEQNFRNFKKVLKTVTLEEVDALKTKLLKPEKFVTSIVKPC